MRGRVPEKPGKSAALCRGRTGEIMRDFGADPKLDQYQVEIDGYPRSTRTNGCYTIKPKGLAIICSDGGGWEHVSVSKRTKTPSYEDMCWCKEMFWGPDATVMQLHVPESEHINCHNFCLHLWRPTDSEIPRPPSIFVGPTGTEQGQGK